MGHLRDAQLLLPPDYTGWTSGRCIPAGNRPTLWSAGRPPGCTGLRYVETCGGYQSVLHPLRDAA
ncbi:MAG: hypothetical protein AMXMBFR45_10570 [Gammaproteobacteria bacterium]|nr:MAG: hypothetical protein BroJett010_12220 [Gammaproteobacteria bacterium]